MYIAFNKNNTIVAVSETHFAIQGCTVEPVADIKKEEWFKLIGKKAHQETKEIKDLKIAVICNWQDNCGISTYSKYLVDSMRWKVKQIKIFSEMNQGQDPDAVYCWRRGQSMSNAINLVLEWKPDFIIIQHEFGIFPNAKYFLQMLSLLDHTPYVVVMHSVYEHLDKSICSNAMKHIIVHSEKAKNSLEKLGNNSQIFVIPHGCVTFDSDSYKKTLNIFKNISLIQFGFGFFYKGVDRALDAIHYLKINYPEKYKDIFYCYLCSNNKNSDIVHTQYYEFLLDKIKQLGLQDNVVIIKKFHTDQAINNYLKASKIALFPYISDPKNTVFGASGAVRIAMANNIPVICSDSHLFDDLEGVVPRCMDVKSLALEIDKIFSEKNYQNKILASIENFINNNTWNIITDRYLEVYTKIN